MGRTIPSFRIALGMEKEDWKPFRNALDKSDRKLFDEMFDVPKFYISACSNSIQYVRLHPILMSILLYHYKQLTKCTSEVEQIEARVNKHRRSTKKEEEKEDSMAVNKTRHKANIVVLVPRPEDSKKIAKRKKKSPPTALKEEHRLDGYFISHNKIAES